MQMAVFRGGFTRKAVQTITGASLRQLTNLVNKALLRRDNTGGRYEIHELLRQFAERQLEATGEADSVYTVHMNYYAEALKERENHLIGRRQLEALDEIEGDFENVRAAWTRAIEQKQHQVIENMLEAISLFAEFRNRNQEGEALLAAAFNGLYDAAPETLIAKIQIRQGWLDSSGEFERIEALSRASLDVAREHDDQTEVAYCLWRLAFAVAGLDKPEQALELTHESLSIYTELNDKWGMALTHRFVGFLNALMYNRDLAYQHTFKAYQLFSEVGNKLAIAGALSNLAAFVMSVQHDWELAEDYYRQALALAREIGSPRRIAITLCGIGFLMLRQGQIDEAEGLAQEALMFVYDANLPATTAVPLELLSDIAELREDYNRAYQLELEAYNLAHISPNQGRKLGTTLRRGWLLCCLGAYDESIEYLLEVLQMALDVEGIGAMLAVIEASALIKQARGQSETALEYLALIFEHPETDIEMTSKIPKLIQLQQQLKAELGKKAYNAAWERGKSLDVLTVAQQLLDEFAEDES